MAMKINLTWEDWQSSIDRYSAFHNMSDIGHATYAAYNEYEFSSVWVGYSSSGPEIDHPIELTFRNPKLGTAFLLRWL